MSTRKVKRILIVEDDKDNLECYEAVLQKLDYKPEILWARDGLEAFEMVSSGIKADLIVLDIMMPRMSGDEFLLKMHEELNLNIPVIISSVNKYMAAKLYEISGVEGVFYKLDKLEDFLKLVKETLD